MGEPTAPRPCTPPRPPSPSLLCPALATACVLCLSQGPGATRPTLAPLHSLQYELPISLARGWDRLGSVCLELALGCHLPVCTDPWDAWPHWLGTPCPGSSLSSPQTRAVALSPCAPRPRDTSHYPIVRSHVFRAGQRWAPQLSEACSHPRAARQACVSWGSPVAPTHSLWGPSRCWRKGSPWQQRLCPFTALTLAPKAVWRRAQR